MNSINQSSAPSNVDVNVSGLPNCFDGQPDQTGNSVSVFFSLLPSLFFACWRSLCHSLPPLARSFATSPSLSLLFSVYLPFALSISLSIYLSLADAVMIRRDLAHALGSIQRCYCTSGFYRGTFFSRFIRLLPAGERPPPPTGFIKACEGGCGLYTSYTGVPGTNPLDLVWDHIWPQ